jgi:putative protein-disulfide isomerase
MKPLLIYCYDAYCGWCYGFSPVIRKVHENFQGTIDFEVLSGGMILPEQAKHISVMADFIRNAYPNVETTTGIRFGEDYLWHVMHPEMSDWLPCSEKPAIALSIFKEYDPERQVSFATDLQVALHGEGRDLCDNEAYRHLLERYGIPQEEFYQKLNTPGYKDKAYYEFQLCKQLQVNGYPTVLLQKSADQFYLLAHGYTSYDILQERIHKVLDVSS